MFEFDVGCCCCCCCCCCWWCACWGPPLFPLSIISLDPFCANWICFGLLSIIKLLLLVFTAVVCCVDCGADADDGWLACCWFSCSISWIVSQMESQRRFAGPSCSSWNHATAGSIHPARILNWVIELNNVLHANANRLTWLAYCVAIFLISGLSVSFRGGEWISPISWSANDARFFFFLFLSRSFRFGFDWTLRSRVSCLVTPTITMMRVRSKELQNTRVHLFLQKQAVPTVIPCEIVISCLFITLQLVTLNQRYCCCCCFAIFFQFCICNCWCDLFIYCCCCWNQFFFFPTFI